MFEKINLEEHVSRVTASLPLVQRQMSIASLQAVNRRVKASEFCVGINLWIEQQHVDLTVLLYEVIFRFLQTCGHSANVSTKIILILERRCFSASRCS